MEPAMIPVDTIGRLTSLARFARDPQGEIGSILKQLAEEVSFDVVTFYRLLPKQGLLRPEHSNLGVTYVAGTGFFRSGEGIVGACADKGEVLHVSIGDKSDPASEKWGEDFQGYKTLLAAPVALEGNLTGVLLFLHREHRPVGPEEREVFSLLGRELAWVMTAAGFQKTSQTRERELAALSEISRAAGSTLELGPLTDMILRTAVQVMDAKGGVLRVLDEDKDFYRLTSSYGKGLTHHMEFRPGADSECVVVRSGAPYLMRDSKNDLVCREEMRYGISSCVCVPLEHDGRTVGVLSVYDKETSSPGGEAGFGEGDTELLQTMAGFIASALVRAMHHRKIAQLVAEKEAMVHELSILYATSAAMMKTVDIDLVLRVILMGVTVGDGLGFNRAMLFLVNRGDGMLEGRVGAGPGSADEAGRVWSEIQKYRWSLSDWLDWALEQDKWAGEEGVINRVARGIRVSLDDERCVLIQCLRQKKAFTVPPGHGLYGREMLGPLEVGGEFACAPILARGEPLGVILVDNIYSARPIGERDLRFLTAFASQAGLAIQNALLYEGLRKAHKELQAVQQRLIQSERLAALGEFSASVAHEIRNPLVSIGGYARLLQKKHRDVYSQIIYQEVGRLENILNRVLAFSKAAPAEWKEEDLNFIVEESLQAALGGTDPRRLEIRREWTRPLPAVHCDKGQLKQVFVNLIQNSLEAMEGRGVLAVKTYLSSEEDGLWAVAEVMDTGKGIPGDLIHNIFNPFFTTKEKGTGLGLAITRRIVEAHGGRIELVNRPGEGSIFKVKLPVAM